MKYTDPSGERHHGSTTSQSETLSERVKQAPSGFTSFPARGCFTESKSKVVPNAPQSRIGVQRMDSVRGLPW